MASGGASRRLQRVVIALRSHSEAISAVNAATVLAQALEAELFGLFVEEETALSSSALPFAQVVRSARKSRDLSPENMLAAFEHDAVACRRLISSRASRASLSWNFSRVRGETYRVAGDTAKREDILLLQEPYGGSGVRKIIAGARAMSGRHGGMVLLGPWQPRQAGPVVAIIESVQAKGGIDSPDADERILQLALLVARKQRRRLLLFLVGGHRDEADEALRQARARMPPGEIMDGYIFPGDPVTEVCHGLHVCAPSFVLLDVEGVLFQDDARAEQLLRRARCPVALLRSRD